MILKVIAKLMVISLPPRLWYRVSFKITGKLCKVRPLKDTKLQAINHATKLDALLSLLTSKGGIFPIPINVIGLDLFDKPRPNGIILCSVHLPLLQATIRVLAEKGNKPNAVIIKRPVKNDSVPLLGTFEEIPVIYNGSRVLIKAKDILKKGGSFIVLTDEDIGDELYSPNIFRFAHKLETDMIYFFAELLPDGKIEASFFEAPNNNIGVDELIKERIETLNNYRNKILNINQKLVIAKPVVSMHSVKSVR